MIPALTINEKELGTVKCRHGCDEVIGIYHTPEGCNCFTDQIQALCAQHYEKLHSTGRMIWLVARIEEAHTPYSIIAIRQVLEHYQRADDASYTMLKGFAARKGEGDPKSPARRAIAILERLRRKGGLA